MRLIDTDKLIAHLNDFALSVAPPFKDNSWEYKLSQYGYKTIQECIRGVEEQPTIEAITVEWLKQKANDLAYAYWHGVKNKLTLPMKDLPLVIETMVQYWEKENETNRRR